MYRPLLLALTLSLAAGCAGKEAPPEVAAAPDADLLARFPDLDKPLPFDPGITTGTLDNGLTWFIEPNNYPEDRLELRLVVNAGSILEDDDQLGLAHFVEHMAFNGSEHFDGNELVQYLESTGSRFGPDLNAYTSFNETVYILRVPTDDQEILDKSFLVLQDWAQGLKFDSEEIDRERGVVLDEWRRGLGPYERIRDELMPLLFGERYADRLPIGTEESLKGFEHASASRFYQDWYRPDLMAVVLAGNVEVDWAKQKIEEHFSGLENPAQERERSTWEAELHPETRYAVKTDPELTRSMVSLARKFEWSWDPTERHTLDSAVESLLLGMLKERMGDQAKSDEPPNPGAGARPGGLSRGIGTYNLSVGAFEGSIERGLEAALTEVRRAELHGFTEAELERARAAQLKSWEKIYAERDHTESASHAAEIIRHFLTGENMPGTANEYELNKKYLSQVGLDQVNAFAAEWMQGDSMVVTAILPEKEGLEAPTTDALRAVVDAAAASSPEPLVAEAPLASLVDQPPAAGTIETEDKVDELGLTVWTLSNGVKVMLKPTDFKADEVRFTSYSWGGSSLSSDEDYIASVTATSLVAESGVGALTRTQLSKALAGRSVGVSPYIGGLYEGISGSASPDYLEVMFQLIHLYATAPRFDEGAFNREVAERAEQVKNRLSDPGTVFGDAWSRLLYGDHPRYQPWTLETLEQMDLETSSAFYADRFADWSDGVFVFVGAFDLETIEPLITTWLGSLPSIDREETWEDETAPLFTGVQEEVVYAGAEPKAQVRIAFAGEFEATPENRYAMRGLSDVLSAQLREKLREELGGTYGVGVSASASVMPREEWTFTVSFGCEPDRVEELIDAAYEVIRTLQAAPPDDRYVENVQEQHRRKLETDRQQNGYWMSMFERYDREGLDPLEHLKYEELIDGLTPEGVQATAKLLDMNRRVEAVLLPEAMKP